MRGTERDSRPPSGEADEDDVKSSGPSGEGIEPSHSTLADGEGAASPSVAGGHMMSHTTVAGGEPDASPSALSGKTYQPGGAFGETAVNQPPPPNSRYKHAILGKTMT